MKLATHFTSRLHFEVPPYVTSLHTPLRCTPLPSPTRVTAYWALADYVHLRLPYN